MSRIGNKIIEIPDKVNVEVLTDHVKVSGPKGSLSVYVNEGLKVTQESNTLSLERPSDSRTFRSLHGTVRQLIANAVHGVSEGFEKELEISFSRSIRQVTEGERAIPKSTKERRRSQEATCTKRRRSSCKREINVQKDSKNR